MNSLSYSSCSQLNDDFIFDPSAAECACFVAASKNSFNVLNEAK